MPVLLYSALRSYNKACYHHKKVQSNFPRATTALPGDSNKHGTRFDILDPRFRLSSLVVGPGLGESAERKKKLAIVARRLGRLMIIIHSLAGYNVFGPRILHLRNGKDTVAFVTEDDNPHRAFARSVRIRDQTEIQLIIQSE